MKIKKNKSLRKKEMSMSLCDLQNEAARLQKEIDEQKIYIVNAGIMNHGKSSLFNSMLGRDEFKVADKRETIVCQETLWKDNTFFVDTPGLAADSSDDETAHDAYKKADAIIYVHTLKVGELQRKEIEAIQHLAKIFESAEYFWQHFCLVFTSFEEYDNRAIAMLKEKSLADIASYCGGTKFPVFVISNTRYKKGAKLREKSGIPQLKQYLEKDVIAKCKADVFQRKSQELYRLKQKMLEEIKLYQATIEKQRNIRAKECQDKIDGIKDILDVMKDTYEETVSIPVQNAEKNLRREKKTLEIMIGQHEEARRNY